MKSISKILIFTSISFFFANISHSELKLKYSEDCAVIVKTDGFASYFPLNDLNEFPINNKINPQYYWMTEVGSITNEKFHPNNFAYSASTPISTKETKYSLLEIIDKTIVSLHLSSTALNIENEDQIKFGGLSFTPIEDGLMIASKNTDYYGKLFKEKPSHARLTFKTPNDEYSYSCLTKINYLN